MSDLFMRASRMSGREKARFLSVLPGLSAACSEESCVCSEETSEESF